MRCCLKYGIEESDQTHFGRYAESWLKRQTQYFKATTLSGYKRNLEIVYPFIGGIPLAKIRPLTLEEMCEDLRKRPGRCGNVKERTVRKYLETVSSVLEDAKKTTLFRSIRRIVSARKLLNKRYSTSRRNPKCSGCCELLWRSPFCTKR